MNENTLPFPYTGGFICRYLRYGDVILAFFVFICVDIIDTRSGTDAFGKYRFIHFDDVLMLSGMQDSNLPETLFQPDEESGYVPRLFPLRRDFPPGSGFDNEDDATTLTGTQRQLYITLTGFCSQTFHLRHLLQGLLLRQCLSTCAALQYHLPFWALARFSASISPSAIRRSNLFVPPTILAAVSLQK